MQSPEIGTPYRLNALGIAGMVRTYSSASPETRISIIDSLETSDQYVDLCFAAQFAIDTAWDLPSNSDLKSHLFDKAEGLSVQIIQEREVYKNLHERVTATAALMLVSMDISRGLSDGIMPSQEQITQYTDGLTDLACYLNYDIWIFEQLEKFRKQTDLIGILSEINVLALLNRFSTRNIGDGSYVAVPARYSEDRALKPGEERDLSQPNYKQGWDISVFAANACGEPRLAHKIQVKNRYSSHNVGEVYAPDISVIYERQDLVLGYGVQKRKDKNYVQHNIVRDLALEREGDKRATEHLDRRTEKLLEIMG